MACGCAGSTPAQAAARAGRAAPAPRERREAAPGRRMADAGPGKPSYYWNGPPRPEKKG